MDLGLRPNVLCYQGNVSLCLCNRFSKATPTISRKCGTTLFLQLKRASSEYVPCSGTRGSPLKWSCWAANLMQVRLIRNQTPIRPISHAKHYWISFCWLARPRIFHPAPPPPRRKSTVPPLQERTTHTPNIRNTTMPPHSHDGKNILHSVI